MDRLRAEGRVRFQGLKGKEDGDKVGGVGGSPNEHVKWQRPHDNMF